MLPRDGRELGAAGAIGQLPEAERIAHDDELGGLRPDGDLPQELDQFVLEVATGESTVPADVEVADKVVGRRHAGGDSTARPLGGPSSPLMSLRLILDDKPEVVGE